MSTTAHHHFLTWGGPVQRTNRIERGYRWWALGAVLIVMFTASLSSTIVSTAVPTIVADLNGFDLYGWIFQGVIGRTAQSSGVILTPMMLSYVVAAAIAGQFISRTGRYKLQGILGMGAALTGLVLFAALTSSSTSREVVRDMIVLGAGMGIVMPIFTITIQSAFPHEMLGTVNAARQFFVNLGAAIGVPVMTAVIVNTFDHELPSRIPAAAKPVLAAGGIDPQSLLTAETQQDLQARFAHLPHGHDTYVGFVHGVRMALSHGIADVFVVGVGFAALAVLLTLVFPVIQLVNWEPTDGSADATV